MNAVIITAVQDERSAALATLLTVHVARFAVSVLETGGTATATATSAARRKKVVREGILLWICTWGLATLREGFIPPSPLSSTLLTDRAEDSVAQKRAAEED